MRQWNKNVLRDENEDNDVAADATAAQTATRHISTRVHRAPHAQSFAHIRRPLRLSEHKCSIRVKFLARSPSRFRAPPLIYDPRREHRTGFARASPRRAGGYPL